MPLRPITNPFKELGLRPHHTEQDVKKAYRALALKYHPDKAGQKGEEKMKLINAAHEEIMSKRLARLATPPRAAKQRSEERRRQQKYTSPTPSSHKRRSSEDADDIEIDTDDSKDSPSPTQPSHDDDEGSEKGAGEVDPNYYSEAGTQYEAKEDIRFKHDWQFILLLLHAYVEAATSRQYRIQGSRAIDRFDRAKIILRQLDYVFKGTKPKSRAEICRRIGRIFDYLKRVEVSDCPRLAEARAKDASLSFDRMAREAGIDDFLRDKTVEARGSSRSYARSAFDESGEIWTADEMWFEAECERQADLSRSHCSAEYLSAGTTLVEKTLKIHIGSTHKLDIPPWPPLSGPQPKPDPFTTLGIPRSSTKNNVSKAYHKLALQYHPDKAGHEGTAKSQEIQAAYEEIFTRNLCSDSSARVEEGEGSSFDSSDRAIWEGPPIPPNLSEKERFDLMKGRLKRFFEGKRGRRLGGADQDAAYASFELQIQNQLEVLQGLTHTMDTRIGTAVGHALFALKRMWVDNTIGVRSELVGSFQCQTVASAIGVLGLVSHKTMRCAVSHFVELEANWIRATAKSEPQVQNWPGIGGPGSQALNVACTGPSGDEDVEMMDV